jgi:probable addiction module antidote protein
MLKTSPFDPMEHLDTPEDHIELLNDALATGDRGVVAGIIGEIARARGMTGLSRLTGIGRQSLYAALDEKGNPTLETFLKVLDALKLELRAAPKADAA